jgi:mediator of RNA polymerase II transcription subunit 5
VRQLARQFHAHRPETLFSYLPNPPAVIIKYLSHCLSHHLVTARIAVIHLLLQPNLGSVPSATLDTICQTILLNSTGLDVSNPLPSRLDSPLPDIGPSSPSSTNWTISLLLPLLRTCTTTKVPQATTQLIGRILSIVEPYPAPPFDVGLDASQLMGSLPDEISIPLRQSLSGLMTDLAISEGSAQQAQVAPLAVDDRLSRRQPVMAEITDGPAISSIMLADAFSDTIPQAIALLLASYREGVRYDKTEQYASTSPPIPSRSGIDFLKLCWSLGSTGGSVDVIFSADVILDRVLGVILEQVIPDLSGLGAKNVDGHILLLEHLPVMLRWWKDQSNGGLAYPVRPYRFSSHVTDHSG